MEGYEMPSMQHHLVHEALTISVANTKKINKNPSKNNENIKK